MLTLAQPTDLEDILSDDDLRDLARDDHYRLRGELSPEHQRLLAMTLPEICGELLAQRLAARCCADCDAQAQHVPRGAMDFGGAA